MTKAAWAEAIGVAFDPSGLPTQASIADHVRAAAARERYLLRSGVIRALKESYGPFGCDPEGLRAAIVQTLDALEQVGDLTAFASDAGPGYVATPERLVALEGDAYALLGASARSGEGAALFARRLTLQPDEVQEIPVISLAEEIGLPTWRLYLVQAGGADTPRGGPETLFAHLTGQARAGERLARTSLADLRVLAGRGAFFGDPAKPDGRWQAWPGEGAYCSFRRGEWNWLCGLTTEASGAVRTLDLPPDVWRWAQVGQTLAQGDPVARWEDGVLSMLVQPPRQIRRLMMLAGVPEATWRWRTTAKPARLALSLLGQTDA